MGEPVDISWGWYVNPVVQIIIRRVAERDYAGGLELMKTTMDGIGPFSSSTFDMTAGIWILYAFLLVANNNRDDAAKKWRIARTLDEDMCQRHAYLFSDQTYPH